MQQQLVSILIPAFNVESFVSQSVQSALSQSYENIEVLVGDDGSTDATLAVLLRLNDTRLRVLHFESNRGKVRVFNDLLTQARGNLIATQDADDWSHSQRIELQAKVLHENKLIDLTSCNGWLVDANGTSLQPLRYPEKIANHKRTLAESCDPQMLCPALMIRREVYERTGGYRELFATIYCRGEDAYWISDMLDLGFQYLNTCAPLYYYRTGVASLTRSAVNLTSHDFPKIYAMDLLNRLFRSKYELSTDLADPAFLPELETILVELSRKCREDATYLHRHLSLHFFAQDNLRLFRYALKQMLVARTRNLGLRLALRCLAIAVQRKVSVAKSSMLGAGRFLPQKAEAHCSSRNGAQPDETEV